MKFSEKVNWNVLAPTISILPIADEEELVGKKWPDIYNAATSFKYSYDTLNDLRPEPKYYENDYVRGFRTCFRNLTFLK